MVTRDEIVKEADRLRAMLQALIRTAGLSNREVERRMGFSTKSGYLSRLFHGYRELKLRQVLTILAAVGLPPANFFRAAFPDPVTNGEPARLQKSLEAMFSKAGGRMLIEDATRTHPDKHDLERFLRGEPGKSGAAGIVRHLLRGCRTCSAVIGLVWGLSNRRRTHRLDEEDLLDG